MHFQAFVLAFSTPSGTRVEAGAGNCVAQFSSAGCDIEICPTIPTGNVDGGGTDLGISGDTILLRDDVVILLLF